MLVGGRSDGGTVEQGLPAARRQAIAENALSISASTWWAGRVYRWRDVRRTIAARPRRWSKAGGGSVSRENGRLGIPSTSSRAEAR
jgi:hypothetical protein